MQKSRTNDIVLSHVEALTTRNQHGQIEIVVYHEDQTKTVIHASKQHPDPSVTPSGQTAATPHFELAPNVEAYLPLGTKIGNCEICGEPIFARQQWCRQNEYLMHYNKCYPQYINDVDDIYADI